MLTVLVTGGLRRRSRASSRCYSCAFRRKASPFFVAAKVQRKRRCRIERRDTILMPRAESLWTSPCALRRSA